MRILTLRLQIPAGDDAKMEAVKPLVLAAIRGIGRKDFATEPNELTNDQIVLFDAADVKQGPETVKRKERKL